MASAMRTELIYSLGQEERLLPIPSTVARAKRGCDEHSTVLVRTETQLTLGNVLKRPAISP
jgi:hypothetical protein